MLSRSAGRFSPTHGYDSEGGFTLVELLIVMVIVSILMAIAVPSFLNSQKRSRESSAKSDVRSIEMAIERLLTVQMPKAGDPAVAVTGAGGSYWVASTPVTTGQLNPGNVVGANSTYGPNGVYCISVGTSDGTYFKVTHNGQLAPGTC